MININRVQAYIGYLGPLINLFILLTGLFIYKAIPNAKYLTYLGSVPVTVVVNEILKKLINQHRPKKSININKFEEKLDKGSHGMPSGHAQSNGLFLTLGYLSKLPNFIILLMFAITTNTIWQRYTFKKHTLAQLLVGTIVGILVGKVYWELFIKKKKRVKFKDGENKK